MWLWQFISENPNDIFDAQIQPIIQYWSEIYGLCIRLKLNVEGCILKKQQNNKKHNFM